MTIGSLVVKSSLRSLFLWGNVTSQVVYCIVHKISSTFAYEVTDLASHPDDELGPDPIWFFWWVCDIIEHPSTGVSMTQHRLDPCLRQLIWSFYAGVFNRRSFNLSLTSSPSKQTHFILCITSHNTDGWVLFVTRKLSFINWPSKEILTHPWVRSACSIFEHQAPWIEPQVNSRSS